MPLMTTRREKLRKRFAAFRLKFAGHMLKIRPRVAFKILAGIVLLFPWLAGSLIVSFFRVAHWRKIATCQAFLKRHALAFDGVDPETLTVESVSGGVSNSNQIWHCRKTTGEDVRFFVKIFLDAGSFWAKHLAFVSPFPSVYGGKTHERFTVDMISRVQLDMIGVPVPRLIAYDAVEKVMVTEHIAGETVDSILERIGEDQKLGPGDEAVMRQCAIGLARIHRAGFSLIDTQPVNCIWVPVEQKVYFTDLEFCGRQDKRVWDLGFFLCFIAVRVSGAVRHEVRTIFLESYQKERQVDLAQVAETGRELQEYMPVFQAVLDIRRFTPEELFEGIINP
jgi:tRNA A-37 threonylcarbamoyl transferase component Bud32